MTALVRPDSRRPGAAARFVTALLAVTLSIAAAQPARAEEPTEIVAADALSYVGKLVRICGTVTTASYMASSGRQPTFLNFGKPYPNHSFTVLIWGVNRHKFPKPPVQMFDGRQICVTGTVATYKGRPQIIVEDSDQIERMDGGSGEGSLADLEAVFLKALLEAYGEESNYGTGEWDQETIEAMSRFQEAMGLRPTGDPDAETLRVMAKRALDLTDEDRERIIRLLLFRLAHSRE